MTTLQVKFCHDLSLEKPQYRGLLHGVRVILREHGLGGLYQVSVFMTLYPICLSAGKIVQLFRATPHARRDFTLLFLRLE